MKNISPIILGVFVLIIALCLIAIILAYPTMLLWNGCLVDAVDGINQISLWQALGLNVLFGILFKSYHNVKN